MTNLKDSELATIKVNGEEENNVKEFEIQKQLTSFDVGVENKKSYL